MKRVLFALLCIASTGIASAQETIVPYAPYHQGPTLQLVSGRLLATPACCNSPCQPACALPCRSASCPTCLAVPAIKVEKRICYSSACEKVCFKAPSSLLGGCNSDCTTGNCERRSYTQKYLVKKVHVTETPTYKCVPANPNCDNCPGGFMHGYQPSATYVETVPVKPMPTPRK